VVDNDVYIMHVKIYVIRLVPITIEPARTDVAGCASGRV
jgi:hypothetical protein